ncbi:MAG: hypothetical protein JXR97_03890 [Planctomycetes bacterium]|nr:hypothetical protein [Planctomycetota bacterium]
MRDVILFLLLALAVGIAINFIAKSDALKEELSLSQQKAKEIQARSEEAVRESQTRLAAVQGELGKYKNLSDDLREKLEAAQDTIRKNNNGCYPVPEKCLMQMYLGASVVKYTGGPPVLDDLVVEFWGLSEKQRAEIDSIIRDIWLKVLSEELRTFKVESDDGKNFQFSIESFPEAGKELKKELNRRVENVMGDKGKYWEHFAGNL